MLPLRSDEKDKLGEQCSQVTAVGGMTSKFLEVPLTKFEQGERCVGQAQIPGSIGQLETDPMRRDALTLYSGSLWDCRIPKTC